MKPVMPGTSTPRFKRGGRPHKILASLAAHPDGLTSRQLAGLHGSGTGQRMLTRYGTALRTLRNAGHVIPAGTMPSGRQNTPAIVYQITDAGREYLATLEAPKPKPPERQRAEYPWAEDAARRNHAGESVNALRQDYKVAAATVQRALERRGVPVLQHVERPRRHPQPEWAAEAAQRYRNGEPRSALCAAYKAGDREMTRALKAEGVVIRGLREALQLRASLARQREQQPGVQLPDGTPPSRHDRVLPAPPEAT